MSEKDNKTKKPSISVPGEMHDEMLEQAERYGISVSKCVQDAWRIARVCVCAPPDGVALFRDGPIVGADDEADEEEEG